LNLLGKPRFGTGDGNWSGQFALDETVGDGCFEVGGDEALGRSGAEERIVQGPEHGGQGFVGDIEADTETFETPGEL
jgi:hypothetical protein